jgi:HPt (histidine-containing phosphotransfer) domain-containing protein
MVKYRKLIDTQKELLKVYLNENSSISNVEARNLLEEETGLEANISAVGDEMKRLRKLANLYNNSTDSVTAHSIKESKGHRYDYKLKDKHIERLKVYLQRNIYISSEEAKNRLYRETGLEIGNQTLLRAMEKLKREIGSENDNFDLTTAGSLANIKYKNSRAKLKDTHLKLLKQYLKDNSSISPEQASDMLQDETDLLVSTKIVKEAINKLKVELSTLHNSFDPPISTSNTSKKPISNGFKVKNIHIDHLDKYLREGNYIGPTEATNRLCKDTGLKLNSSTTSIYLKRLREEMGPEYFNTDTSIIKNRKLNCFAKLKDSHLECLKNYLKNNRFIKSEEARNQLQIDTGLNASTSTIRKRLRVLREEIFPNSNAISLPLLDSENNKVLLRSNLKIMDKHKSCLKRYLMENKNIKSNEAKDLLYKETGLEVSGVQICVHLRRLRQEIGHEYINNYTSSTKNSKPYHRIKIKDSHLECLKTYLKKDRFIRYTEATRQLHKETGLQVSVKTVAKAIRWIRKEKSLDSADLDNTMVKSRQFDSESNIKDTTIAFLKKYLNSNKFIGPVDAMNKLREETDLNVDILTIHQSLKMLKKEASLIT